MSEYILKATGISKAFPGTKALSGVNFCIRSGEVMGLVGENGAGKSTLMKIITGVYSHDSGEILFANQPVHFKNSLEALEAGVAIIHQELNLFKNLSVYENIYLNRKNYRNAAGRINRKKMNTDTAALMKLLGADIAPETMVYSLSIREQQVVEIARAISANARVIIMDEPSAALTESEVNKLFEVIRKLKEQNVAVVYVSHRMNEIKQICDCVTILRDGKNVGLLKMAEHQIHDIITQMVGREIENYYPKNNRELGEVIFSVNQLDCGFLRGISFETHANEVVCIYGLAGSGTTELSECIFGLRAMHAGEIRIKGKKASRMTPGKAIKLGMAYVPPDRRGEGIVADQSIENNIILASFREDSIFTFLKRKKITAEAERCRRELNIKSVNTRQRLVSLSGGNQQKVVLAKWLKTQPAVLLLNEPTRGVDIGAKAEIYALIDKLAQGGISVILISSEVPEVIGMANRVLVMNKGKIVCGLMAKDCSQEVLLRAASGGLTG